jgi:predicted GTPase
MGYSPTQVAELRDTIDAVTCDAVVLGTPVDLRRSLEVRHPVLRVRYELEEAEPGTLAGLLDRTPISPP